MNNNEMWSRVATETGQGTNPRCVLPPVPWWRAMVEPGADKVTRVSEVLEGAHVNTERPFLMSSDVLDVGFGLGMEYLSFYIIVSYRKVLDLMIP